VHVQLQEGLHGEAGCRERGYADVLDEDVLRRCRAALHPVDDDRIRTRFRPDFFPYTEPSAELAVSCIFCGGDGCRVCSQSGWIELGGCGMVDPNVLQGVGIDPEEFSGFAFGFGLERIAMVRYDIDEIKTFFDGDVRFLAQY